MSVRPLNSRAPPKRLSSFVKNGGRKTSPLTQNAQTYSFRTNNSAQQLTPPKSNLPQPTKEKPHDDTRRSTRRPATTAGRRRSNYTEPDPIERIRERR